MRYALRITLVLTALALTFALAGFAADDDPVTVAGILKAADCALTDAQQKSLDAINPDEGMMGIMGIGDTFTDEQVDALIAKLGERQMPEGMGGGGGMGGMGEMPVTFRINNLMQVIILGNEDVPLTEGQIAKLNEAAAAGGGRGMGMMGGGSDILTEEQTEAFQKYFSGMGGPGGGGGFGGGGGMR